MKKRILACLLTAAMVFTSADFTVFATETVETVETEAVVENSEESAEQEGGVAESSVVVEEETEAERTVESEGEQEKTEHKAEESVEAISEPTIEEKESTESANQEITEQETESNKQESSVEDVSKENETEAVTGESESNIETETKTDTTEMDIESITESMTETVSDEENGEVETTLAEETVEVEDADNVGEDILTDSEVLTGQCGDNLTWTLEDGTLTISGTGEMWDYADSNSYKNYKGDITTLVMEEGITSIGHSAFSDCNMITNELRIPNSVTNIEDYAFFNCSSITGDLKIPNNVKNIGVSVFSGCSGFNGSLIIESDITSIPSGMFYSCSGFTGSLNIPESVTHIEYGAFYGCSGFTGNLNIPKSVTHIGYGAFNGCSGFTGNLKIPDNVTDIDTYAFADCTGFNGSLVLSNSLKHIGYGTFCECVGFKEIYFTSEVVSINTAAFRSITANVYYPDSSEEWDSVINNDYGGKLTWIPYTAGTRPWEKNYDLYDIQVYSEFANLFIGEEQTCVILPAMVHGDDVLMGEEGWSFSIENTQIAEIREYIKDEIGTAARIIGKSAGNTKLHIIHIPTGKSVDLVISVAKNILTYEISDVVNYKENEGIINYGIVTKNYKSEKIGDEYLITFDAYNECASAGAVEVHNAEGKLIGASEIKKFEAYQTGIKEVFMDGWNLVCSGVNGSLLDITNSMYTEHTPISVKVPEGGYIIITNDVVNSMPASVYNIVDLSVWIYKEAKVIKEWDDKKPFQDKAKDNICQAIIDYFIKEASSDKLMNKFQEKLGKELLKGKLLTAENGMNILVDLINGTDNVLNEIDVDLGKEIVDAAVDTGIDVAMDAFEKFSITGEALELIFGVNEFLNGAMQLSYMSKTMDARQIRIEVTEDRGKLVSEGVIIESEEDVIPEGTELRVVDITEEETSKYIIENLKNSSQFTIYNITLYKDEVETQPNGKIKIKVPLPALYNGKQCMIYRMETDGSLTDMNAQCLDGYMVFETEHLSNYILYQKIVYSISFDGNGATSGNMEAICDCVEGQEYVLPTNKYEKEEYVFNGWNTAIDGKGTFYIDGATVKDIAKMNDENVVLYAQWVYEKTEDTEGVLPEDIPSTGIPNGLWIAGIDEAGYIYTGTAVKPEVRVYDNNKRLISGKDYTISYKNNKKACILTNSKTAPTIIVKGKGDYAGTETATFKINPINLNDTNIDVSDITVSFNNKMQKKIPTVTYNGKKLSGKKDFSVSYTDNSANAYKAIGSYNLVLNGKGNFTGTRTIKLVVTDNILISKASVSKVPNYEYTGQPIEPPITVSMNKAPLIMGSDYTVSYKNNTEIGTATVIVTGIGKYAGTKKLTFKILGEDLKKAQISGIENKVYNGQKQEQTFTVQLNGKKLVQDADYKVSYTNNVNAGKAVITITGINAYSGTVKKNFKITPYDLNADTDKKLKGLESNIQSKYVKGGSKPKPVLTFDGKVLIEGKDYTISYKNNKAVSATQTGKAPLITIKGKGNFKGTITKSFTISAKALNDADSPVTIHVPDMAFVDKAGKYISKPVLIDADGKKLVAGKDYDKSITYTLENGTILTKNDKVQLGTNIKVTVKGIGAYSGTLEAVYQITKSDFSKAKIKISAQSYTGKEILLDSKDISVTIGGRSLTYGTDYEILSDSYINNIQRGTASVIIIGKGNYGGSKTVKFKIVPKQLSWFWKIFT